MTDVEDEISLRGFVATMRWQLPVVVVVAVGAYLLSADDRSVVEGLGVVALFVILFAPIGWIRHLPTRAAVENPGRAAVAILLLVAWVGTIAVALGILEG